MPEADPTVIGRVKHVLGATVTIALDHDLAGVAPVWEGRVQAIGQVGSIVRIPQGPITILATVTLVGIAELSGTLRPSLAAQVGERWLQAQLLGEVTALGLFQRGVSTYPGLDDPVHFTTLEHLQAVYPRPDNERVRLGGVAAAPEIALSLAASKLVMRHSAIVGSTGSGKSSAVATMIQAFTRSGWTGANIVVIDPHGEYGPAVGGVAAVRSVLGTGRALLRVPFWALPAGDILAAFCGQVDSVTITSRFGELVTASRRAFLNGCAWLSIDADLVGADTPIPFDLRDVWHKLDWENRATYSQAGGAGEIKLVAEGDPQSLRPAEFEPHSAGNTAPYKGPRFGHYGTVPDRLRARLSDPRFRFFQEPAGEKTGSDPLVEVIQDWLGGEQPVSVLDFSGVPADATDLAVGVVMDLLFEVAVRSETVGIGRPRPVLIVLEEAHRYLGDSANVRIARESANRIAREGRKYGVGLMLVTQRPSELPATALAQVGTIVALRLTNGSDQGTVKAALPDSVAGLADVLPSLRTGEAIVSGEAVALPTRVLVDLPSPTPEAGDPDLGSWRQAATINDVALAVARWRGMDGAT